MARTQSEKQLASELSFDPKKVAALYNEHGFDFLRKGKDIGEPITGTDIVRVLTELRSMALEQPAGGYAGTARLQAQTFDAGGGCVEIRYTLDLGVEMLDLVGPEQMEIDFSTLGFYL